MITSCPASVACLATRPNALLAFAFAPLGPLASYTGVHVLSMCPCLGQWLIRAAAVVVGAVGEEEVDDQADDGENEDT